MAKSKVAITLDTQLLHSVDRLVALGQFASRSEAIQMAIAELLAAEQRQHVLLRELVKLDISEEQALAEEGLTSDVAWPKY